ncbi:hypothetical protein XNC1_4527 [Xenorhabdus nematophila ATCC 19061]|uniref:Uncharacterized protein n=1 Tax=Xenorhabdus nematophila (strain ATCC 19061 / DSM 3370 / CCUG 14189 / LMG 1036 / NCIMB 9965 / AN6) TaxID=406817 RepID=D3VF92_XENNA|nr:hypothetical protein XNC1_4527 [Xenorhabdus nematophila ATCC 19061]
MPVSDGLFSPEGKSKKLLSTVSIKVFSSIVLGVHSKCPD